MKGNKVYGSPMLKNICCLFPFRTCSPAQYCKDWLSDLEPLSELTGFIVLFLKSSGSPDMVSFVSMWTRAKTPQQKLFLLNPLIGFIPVLVMPHWVASGYLWRQVSISVKKKKKKGKENEGEQRPQRRNFCLTWTDVLPQEHHVISKEQTPRLFVTLPVYTPCRGDTYKRLAVPYLSLPLPGRWTRYSKCNRFY